MSNFKQKIGNPSFSPSNFHQRTVSPSAHYKSPSNTNSRIKLTQNRYGKSHIADTSYFTTETVQNSIPIKQHQERPLSKQKVFAETAPNFCTNNLSRVQYSIPQNSQSSTYNSYFIPPQPISEQKKYYDPTNRLIDDKINHFINRNHEMRG